MYEDKFGFDEKPFNVTPDPNFIFYSEQHKDALALMLYGVQERRGFVLVSGRVGSGKTTLCRAFLRELDDSTSTAMVLNSQMSATELLQTIAEDFGIELPENPSRKTIIDSINEYVLNEYKNGRNACVIIDESQNLSAEALEQLRLLSNLETDTEKLLQIVLVGQPELDNILNQEELRQLKQRIAVRSYITNLDEEETRDYFQHRLEHASAGDSLNISVSESIFPALYDATDGNPRALNLLGDRMLIAAYVDDAQTLELSHLEHAKEDLAGRIKNGDNEDDRVLHRILDETRSGVQKWLQYGVNYGSSRLRRLFTSGSWSPQIVNPYTVGGVTAVFTILLGLGIVSWISDRSSVAMNGPSDTDVERIAFNREKKEKIIDDPSPSRNPSETQDPSESVQPVTKPADGKLQSGTTPADIEEPQTVDSSQTDKKNNVDITGQSETTTSEPTTKSEQTAPSIDFRVNSYRNPLGVGVVNTVNDKRKNGSFGGLALARFVSYYLGRENIDISESMQNSLEGILPEHNPSTYIPEPLPAQLVKIRTSAQNFFSFGFPVLFRIENGGTQYQLYVPRENRFWDPRTGWIDRSSSTISPNWRGTGFVLAQADFTIDQLLGFGDNGSQVKALQKRLNGAGPFNLPLVGSYGPLTKGSIEKFQKQHGLQVDGIAGTQTKLFLLKESGAKLDWNKSNINNFIGRVRSDVAD